MSDTHSHDHAHTHDHGHSHAHQSPEETIALLTYMIDHNKHHGEDLHEIFHALQDAGKNDAAEKLHEAMHMYDDGNALLSQALELLR